MTNVEAIRSAMKEQGISTAELSRQTGIHSGLIGRYLRQDTAIGLKNAPKIAEALGLEIKVVLFGESEAA